MRYSHQVLAFLGLLCALVLVSLADALVKSDAAQDQLARKAGIVRALELTDLSLFTEARYTRHLSQADRHTAFQDHPMGIEHFPTGSLVTPAPHLIRP